MSPTMPMLVVALLTMLELATLAVGSVSSSVPAVQKFNPNAVRINKCCERFEVMMDGKCTVAVNESEYREGRGRVNSEEGE